MLWMQKTEVLEGYHDGLGCSAQKVYKGGVVRKHVSPIVDWESENDRVPRGREYRKPMLRQLVVTLVKGSSTRSACWAPGFS